MEKSTKKPQQEVNTTITYNMERTNLHDFGYAKSGGVQGDPDVYASYLERIYNGDLVDESYKGITQKERDEKLEKIKVLEKGYDEITSENQKIGQEIKSKEKKIEDHRADLLQIREKRAENHEILFGESFSPMKFGINLFILIMLTFYLFFFYVSATYKALYVDFEKIANNLAEGLSTGSIMPGPYELAEAIRYNYLLFLVPFVFYAFGWAFHVLLDMKNRSKVVLLSLLITITFFVDLLLALIIHTNTETAKELMGLKTIGWSQSTTFFIILCLGFVVYILWSILLDSLLREWKKRQVTVNLKSIIGHLKKDIKMLMDKLIPVDRLKNDIDALKEEADTYVYGNVKGYIDQFTTGWISYLSPDSLRDAKTKCLNIKQDFEEKHKIRPGIIKVVKRRGLI